MGRLLLIIVVLLLLAVIAVPLWLTGQYRGWRFWEDASERAADVRDTVGRALEPVLEPGAERGTLGIRLLPLTPELRRHFGAPPDRGVLVAAIDAGFESGIEVGDVITAIDGRRIDSPGDVGRAVADRASERAVVELYRNRRRREREIEVGRRSRFPTPDIELPGDFSELGERIREVGERYGVMGEGRGADGEQPAGAEPRDADALERRIEALERRIRELEGDG